MPHEMMSRLPPSLERQLILDAQVGRSDARGELVERFMPAIGSIARRYRHTAGLDRTELMQDGVVGLLRALDRFDLDQGTPFWAYASWWVRQAMQQLVAEMKGPIVMSDRALRELARIKAAQREHTATHKHEASTGDLAAATGLAGEQVERLRAAERNARSLDEPPAAQERDSACLVDQLADPSAEDAYDDVADQMEVECLRAPRMRLEARERRILSAHYGLDGPTQSLRQIGEGLGLSAERVRQLEERALSKLRTAATSWPGDGRG